ncbi:hypothetical protein BCR37DRAFT_386781 [Protomyces lactucae-debilis]|uniref:C3H1-type domain-containing protein n=1 Tax=Protomyces lactucae-debilis TaxID=2754530 RepID=A0A1Y2FJJ4_PROLT|nr:uncharacterized protein BCR37DRAFT_386781 [Protomyces lactucae-debilis]ORY83767.1 hypothetical protein BCR37DRAFT_386781 [Protomyces lactucae-debilis]
MDRSSSNWIHESYKTGEHANSRGDRRDRNTSKHIPSPTATRAHPIPTQNQPAYAGGMAASSLPTQASINLAQQQQRRVDKKKITCWYWMYDRCKFGNSCVHAHSLPQQQPLASPIGGMQEHHRGPMQQGQSILQHQHEHPQQQHQHVQLQQRQVQHAHPWKRPPYPVDEAAYTVSEQIQSPPWQHIRPVSAPSPWATHTDDRSFNSKPFMSDTGHSHAYASSERDIRGSAMREYNVPVTRYNLEQQEPLADKTQLDESFAWPRPPPGRAPADEVYTSDDKGMLDFLDKDLRALTYQ